MNTEGPGSLYARLRDATAAFLQVQPVAELITRPTYTHDQLHGLPQGRCCLQQHLYETRIKCKYRQVTFLICLVETELHKWKHTCIVLQICKTDKDIRGLLSTGTAWSLCPPNATVWIPGPINRFPGLLLFHKFGLMLTSKQIRTLTFVSQAHDTHRFPPIPTHPLPWYSLLDQGPPTHWLVQPEAF